jgi:Big-like domain-containing protein
VSAAPKSSLRRGATDHAGPRLLLVRRRLRGHLRLTAKARDRAGIARVELRIDGHLVRARRTGRVSYTWLRRPGRHRIGVVAWDKHGNRTAYQLRLHIRRA